MQASITKWSRVAILAYSFCHGGIRQLYRIIIILGLALMILFVSLNIADPEKDILEPRVVDGIAADSTVVDTVSSNTGISKFNKEKIGDLVKRIYAFSKTIAAFFIALFSIVSAIAGLLGYTVLDWWRTKIRGRYIFVVALQKPITPSSNQNVLDYVTMMFTTLGLQDSGFDWSNEDKVQKSLFRRALVKIGGGIFSHDALTFEFQGNDDSGSKQMLRLEFICEEHLELAFNALVSSESDIKSASPKDLTSFYERYVRYRLRKVLGVIGHAESAYTKNMGKLYSAAGLFHISPYATEVGLIKTMSNDGEDSKLERLGVFNSIPPSNDKQAKLIAESVSDIEHIAILADLTNEGYTKSLVDELYTKHLGDVLTGEAYSRVTSSPGIEHFKYNDRSATIVYLIGSEEEDELQAIIQEHVIGAKAVVVVGMYDHAIKVMRCLYNSVRTDNNEELCRVLVTDGVVNGNYNICAHRLFWSDYWSRDDSISVSIAFPGPPQESLDILRTVISCGVASKGGYPIDYYPVFADACNMEMIIDMNVQRGDSLSLLRSTVSKLVKQEFIEGESVASNQKAREIDSWKMLGDPNFGYFLYYGSVQAALLLKSLTAGESRLKKKKWRQNYTQLQKCASKMTVESIIDTANAQKKPGADGSKVGAGDSKTSTDDGVSLNLLKGLNPQLQLKGGSPVANDYSGDYVYRLVSLKWDKGARMRMWVDSVRRGK
jgi:hypothetical protein